MHRSLLVGVSALKGRLEPGSPFPMRACCLPGNVRAPRQVHGKALLNHASITIEPIML